MNAKLFSDVRAHVENLLLIQKLIDVGCNVRKVVADFTSNARAFVSRP